MARTSTFCVYKHIIERLFRVAVLHVSQQADVDGLQLQAHASTAVAYCSHSQ